MLFLGAGVFHLMSQTVSDIDAVLLFLGCDDPQDIDSEEMERLSALIGTPVMINQADVSDLRSCGLFTPYQVAVLDDYRSRHGDVVSFMEMSLLDGFGEEFIARLKPFVSLAPGSMQSQDKGRARHDVAVRTGGRWREDEGSDAGYAVKYRSGEGGRCSVTAAFSRNAGAGPWYPQNVAGSFRMRFGRIDGQMIAGDFNARFGQGLTLWNGTFMTGLTTPDTFMKKPSGLSQPWSFTGSSALSGISAEFAAGKFVVSTMAAFPGLKSIVSSPREVGIMPALNMAWYGRYGHVSVTNVLQVSPGSDERLFQTGLDAAICIRGVNLFGEVAADWTERRCKALLGSRFQAGEDMDMAIQLRLFQNEQGGVAAGGEYSTDIHRITFSADGTYYPVSKDKDDPYSLQLKAQVLWEMKIASRLRMKTRVSERIRTWGHPFRTDIRVDMSCDLSPFCVMLRLNCLDCDGMGFLSYTEGSYAGETLAIHLRQGVFLIDDWDDRIYVYERDAPGSFNAPAMYGRGLWTGAAAGLKISRSLRLYARAAYTCYPFMEQERKKPGKAELKFQLQCRF